MKITITGSLGNIGRRLAGMLVAQGNEVMVITSSEERVSEIEKLGAIAAVGSITDISFVTKSLSEADAAFLMTPPNMGGQNIIENTTNAGKSYAQAINNSGLKRIVMLSSVGADFTNGTGPITGLHNIEEIYKELSNVNITFLRAGYFYNNFYNDIPLIKAAGILGSNFSAESKIPLVDPEDIATAAAEELQTTTTGHKIRYIVGDYVSALEIAKSLGKAIGKQELQWVEFTDEQALGSMQQAGIPAEIADLYTEMGRAIRKNKLQSDFEEKGRPLDGKIKINNFAIDFAQQFQ